MVDDGDAQRVQSHQAQHGPVEGVSLHHAADGDAQQTLLTAEVGGRASLGAPDAGSGHGDACRGETSGENTLQHMFRRLTPHAVMF